MVNPKTLSEQLIYSTVRLKTYYPNGKEGLGTAFFFRHEVEHEGVNKFIEFMVTNRHVVEGANKGRFLCHVSETDDKGDTIPSGKSVWFEINNFEKAWSFHPSNDVDLAVMPFLPFIKGAEKENKMPYRCCIPNSYIGSDEDLGRLSAVEDVLMVGYPIGLWDEANNMPIIRRGITASHPAINHNGKFQGLIDIACFVGSSGSPVLIVNEGGYSTREGFHAGSSRVVFLGVLFGAPRYTQEGEIQIKEIPTVQIPVSRINIMIHLGYYVKAKALIELIERNFVRHLYDN